MKSLEGPSSSSTQPQLSDSQRSRGLSLLKPALGGSCSLTALIDVSPASSQLTVAVAGDFRAVMGTYDEFSKRWVVETLSEDQTGKNVNWVKRMRAEHPKAESATVIMRGRVLGGLEPTRNFGDAKYKWLVFLFSYFIRIERGLMDNFELLKASGHPRKASPNVSAVDI